MFTVSENYRAAIAASSRTERLTGTLQPPGGAAIALDDSVVQAGSLAIENQCLNGEELAFGAVYAGQLTLRLRTDADRYALYGGQITLRWALRLADGSWEEIPLGVYTVTEAVRRGDWVDLTALDCLTRFDGAFDGKAVSGTPFAIITYLCEKSGVPLANTEAEIAALPNGGTVFDLDNNLGTLSTWRDALAAAAEILGCFATADRGGGLRLAPFAAAARGPAATLAASRRFTTEVQDAETFYTRLAVAAGSDGAELLYSPKGAVSDGLVLTLTGNPLFRYGLKARHQAMADALFGALAGIRYTPASVTATGDPALCCGDLLRLADVPGPGGAKSDVDILLTRYRWVYRGRQTLESKGKNPRFVNKSTVAAQLSQLTGQLSADRMEIRTAANPGALTLAAGAEQQAVRLTATTVKDTAALCWVSAQLTVTPPAAVQTAAATDAAGGALALTWQGAAPVRLTVTFYRNGVADADCRPVFVLDGGQRTLAAAARPEAFPATVTAFYLVPSLAANTETRLDVRLTLSAGSGTAAAQNVQAALLAAGLTGGQAPWDGTLELTENLPALLALASTLAVGGVAGALPAVALAAPVPASFAEAAPRAYALASACAVGGVTGSVTLDETVRTWTFDANAEATYASDYVTPASGSWQLQTAYTAQSVLVPVDSGLCCAVTVDTARFAAVTAIAVG